jgi:copper chaperone CopZ
MKWTALNRLLAALVVVAIGYLWGSGLLNTSRRSVSTAPASEAQVQAQAPLPAAGPGQKKVALEDLGMVCLLCKAAVASRLARTAGIVAYSVDLGSDSATVLYDPAAVDIDGLKQAVAEAGYRVRGVREMRE